MTATFTNATILFTYSPSRPSVSTASTAAPLAAAATAAAPLATAETAAAFTNTTTVAHPLAAGAATLVANMTVVPFTEGPCM
jgi:hypothetical protein